MALVLVLLAVVCPVRAVAVAGRRSTTLTVDLSDNSGVAGDCTIPGRCNLDAALALVDADEEWTVELTVDSESPRAAQLPAGATLRVVGKVPQNSGDVARLHGGFNTLMLVPAGTTVHLRRVRIAQRTSAMYMPAVLMNYGFVTFEESEVANNTQSVTGTGAMTAYASAEAGAIVNNEGGTVVFGDGCHVSNNSATALAFTAAYTDATANAGAISNRGNVTFGSGCVLENNVAVALSDSGCHPEPGGATAFASGGLLTNVGPHASVGYRPPPPAR
jgi:hypothetical protein